MLTAWFGVVVSFCAWHNAQVLGLLVLKQQGDRLGLQDGWVVGCFFLSMATVSSVTKFQLSLVTMPQMRSSWLEQLMAPVQ